MTGRRRHLIASLGLAALAAVCFGLLTWALIEGAVVERTSNPQHSSRGSVTTRLYGTGGNQKLFILVYTRKDSPGKYWSIVGAIAIFGTLFTFVAAAEYRSYRAYRAAREGETSRHDLMAKIDRACQLYPESREVLLRAKTALLELNRPEVETPLDNLLDKVLRAPEREAAMKEIKGLAKAMDLFGKL